MATPQTKASPQPTETKVTETKASPQGQQATMFENFKDFILIFIDKTVFNTVPEVGHLAPLILTVGAAFVSIVTLNYPIAMFALSSVEASLLFGIIQSVAGYAATPFLGVSTISSEARKTKGACESYFQTITPSRFASLLSRGVTTPFPNYPLYYIVFASVYCIQGMLYFKQESSEMGPSYSNRVYLAILTSAMFIILYALFLVINGCDSIFGLAMTALIGGLVGFLITFQNVSVFGKGSVDLLFIPELVRRSGMDYVCVTTQGGGPLTAASLPSGPAAPAAAATAPAAPAAPATAPAGSRP